MDYQDMLAKLGLGSAHPGGYNATLRCLQLLKDSPAQNILEVGCGTGRTATTLAKRGHRVTAIDIREHMIEKAQRRAMLEGVHINWIVGDACNLPFANESFDSIIIESSTVFVDPSKAISEYYRVLKNGGSIYDREMIASESLTEESINKIACLYGVKSVPSASEWKQLFKNAKFHKVSIEQHANVAEELSRTLTEPVDQYQFIDQDLFHDPKFFQLSQKNSKLMFEIAPYLEHGVIIGIK